MAEIVHTREIRHGHIFCGLGSGARGFNKGQARVGNTEARFRCIGGIDVDPAGIRDFERMTGVRGTVRDLFSPEQYAAFHGRVPPAGWTPALPADIRRAFGDEHPHILFLSAPCKGFSGLLAEATSKTDKYQALNELTLRGVWLALEAYADDPVEMIIFENVPRIATRGRHLLDQIVAMLRHYGYSVAETTHDCGEIGGLAQSRKRFLLVARHSAKVPPFLYEPPKRRLRGVGEILDRLPLPGDLRAGPMHRMPALQWQTWVRLAFVEAGSDWRSLNKLNVADGVLTDFGIMPEAQWRDGVLGVLPYAAAAGTITAQAEATTGRFSVADPRATSAFNGGPSFMGVRGYADPVGAITGDARPSKGSFAVADPRKEHWGGGQAGVVPWNDHAPTLTSQRSPLQGAFSVADPREDAGRHHGAFGVQSYDDPAGVVTSGGRPNQGRFSVADPRVDGHEKSVQLGVRPWDRPAACVKGDVSVGTGPYAVSDPRVGQDGPRFSNAYRIVAWPDAARAVTGQGGNSMAAVADPRGAPDRHVNGKYRVTGYEEPSLAVIAGSTTGNGAFVVADPRTGFGPNSHRNKLKVVDYDQVGGTVTGSDRVGSGAMSVADPRPHGLNANGRGVSPDKGVMYVDHYGVLGWDETSKAVSGAAGIDNGRWSVADPREIEPEPAFALPSAKDRLVCVIRALDGTWHRPFTTLELAALQSFFDPEEAFGFELDGKSDSAWRERIGNAVPADAAAAIAGVMGKTLLLAWAGESFMLSAEPIWVQPLAIALAVDTSSVAL